MLTVIELKTELHEDAAHTSASTVFTLRWSSSHSAPFERPRAIKASTCRSRA